MDDTGRVSVLIEVRVYVRRLQRHVPVFVFFIEVFRREVFFFLFLSSPPTLKNRNNIYWFWLLKFGTNTLERAVRKCKFVLEMLI